MYKKPIQPDDAFWRLEVDINPGKLSDFIAVAHDLFRTMDAEGGTLGVNRPPILTPDRRPKLIPC